MPQGDVKANIVSVATGSTYDIKPPAGEEWVIHNVYYSQGTVEFYKTNGTNSIKFDSDGASGGRLCVVYHCTNTQWIQLKNLAVTSTLVGYDGIQTK